MKKFICGLSMVLFSMGIANESKAQYTEVKRGWSSRGKGALIGGAGGAVAGGIIGHGAGGALIGGAAGAGAGYLIGRHKDRERGFERPVKVKSYGYDRFNNHEYGGYRRTNGYYDQWGNYHQYYYR